jgi:hypothetical protein
MKRVTAVLIMLCLSHPNCAPASEAVVGSVKTLKGKASVVRNRSAVAVKIGSKIFAEDALKTGSDGSMAMVFKDDTLLSIGPNSEVVINEFLFSPGEGKLSIITRLLRGTSAYLSGMIGKLSPESVRFETPVANIGIRGTKFAVSVEAPEEQQQRP